MSKIYVAAFLCVAAVAATTPALAQGPVRVGGLTCDASARVGLIVGSRQKLTETLPCIGVSTRIRRNRASSASVARSNW